MSYRSNKHKKNIINNNSNNNSNNNNNNNQNKDGVKLSVDINSGNKDMGTTPIVQNPSKSKHSRKHKSRSLIVPKTIVSDSSDCDSGGGGGGSCSGPGNDSPSSDLIRRFSFRNFRRGRSLSKTRCIPVDENKEIDCAESKKNKRKSNNSDSTVEQSDDSDRYETPNSSPIPSPSIRKSLSVLDFRSFYTTLQRHITTGTPKICHLLSSRTYS